MGITDGTLILIEVMYFIVQNYFTNEIRYRSFFYSKKLSINEAYTRQIRIWVRT